MNRPIESIPKEDPPGHLRIKFLIAAGVLLFMGVLYFIAGDRDPAGDEPAEVMLIYKEKSPSLETRKAVKDFLSEYHSNIEVVEVLMTDPDNRGLMDSLRLPLEHFPFALAVNGKTSARIGQDTVIFAKFPDFMHHMQKHEGNWTLEHLELVLNDTSLLLEDNPRVVTIPGGGIR